MAGRTYFLSCAKPCPGRAITVALRDLDDTSVTQSALEEVLLSNLGNNGGMGSCVKQCQ